MNATYWVVYGVLTVFNVLMFLGTLNHLSQAQRSIARSQEILNRAKQHVDDARRLLDEANE